MSVFDYRVKNKEGKYQEGTIEAESQDEALNKLEEKGLIVVSVKQKQLKKFKSESMQEGKKYSGVFEAFDIKDAKEKLLAQGYKIISLREIKETLLKPQKLSTKVKDQNDSDGLLAAISFFLPVIGFILGIAFIVKPRQSDKNTGKRCFAWAFVGMIIGSIIMGIWWYQATRTFQRDIEQITEKFQKDMRKIETTCMICNGKGKVDCPICVNGKATNPLTGKEMSCTFCNGTGIMTCTFCNGTGKPQ